MGQRSVVTFDSAKEGTLVSEWNATGRLAALPAFRLGTIGRLVVVAPHPDDETLGAGGLIAEADRLNIPVTVIVVTDGARSNPESAVPPEEIAATRSLELRSAIAELSASASVVELGFADGQTDDDSDAIAAALAKAVPTSATIAAPWRGDGHHDHRIIGEICATLAAANRVMLLEYPIWMWHWAHPAEPSVPWSNLQSLRLSRHASNAKRVAIGRHHSQVVGLGAGSGNAPVLRPAFLAHFQTGREYFIVGKPAGEATKTRGYFDRLYAQNSDPWRLSTRWYESRKRAISVESLPRERYSSALEIGCSVGELTAAIAERAEMVLAIDISQSAVDAATDRTESLGNVSVERRDATADFPTGPFDLIVLSEVAYYWDLPTLHEMVTRLRTQLTDDGTLLACHWRHPVADYPLRGDTVHEVLRATTGLERTVFHEEEDFVLEIFGRSSDSVARREGLLS